MMKGYALYWNISKRMIAVFIAQALSVIGAGSLVGINDGELTMEEVNQAFGILDSKTHNDMNGREV